MRRTRRAPALVAAVAAVILGAPGTALASSHMDAPLITLDDAANTTDVYAFLTEEPTDGKYLSTALSVYPFEEPGIGPNNFGFDDNVLYAIHVATGSNLLAGRATFTYEFQFDTRFRNEGTILQMFLGPVSSVNDPNLNKVTTYEVTKVAHSTGRRTVLGTGRVPPNNQGLLTPLYNQGDNGENPAKEGVASVGELDPYTQGVLAHLANGYVAFAGQRDDGFYADIQSIFDLDFTFGGPNKPFDSQGGFNVHTIFLGIPVHELGGDQQVVGVYATTSRRQLRVLRQGGDNSTGDWVQVGRQGNPLFAEALVALRDKDLYNRTRPTFDREFRRDALEPELAAALGLPADLLTNRTDIAGIFIPDLIKTDLSTAPARLAGNPDDPGFNRLGVFGGDVLVSTVQPGLLPGGVIPGGWPNGRRFGDDVLDIAVMALASDLRVPFAPVLCSFCNAAGDVDRVTSNDITYNKVAPYAATPMNGRNHPHH